MHRILVPLAVEPAERSFAQRHFARSGYLEKLLKYQLLPILLPTIYPADLAELLYRESSGLLLMGGDDFDPELYGEVRHPLNDIPSPERDRVELALIERAVQDRKPLLGICRGCQALGIASGGSLVQHIPDLPGTRTHKPDSYANYNRALTSVFHDIQIEPSSHLAQILGVSTVQTNSAHHQAVETVGPSFRVNARSADGIIEGVEHVDRNYFCIGVQSHPEAAEPSFMEPLFERFAEAVVTYASRG